MKQPIKNKDAELRSGYQPLEKGYQPTMESKLDSSNPPKCCSVFIRDTKRKKEE